MTTSTSDPPPWRMPGEPKSYHPDDRNGEKQHQELQSHPIEAGIFEVMRTKGRE